MDMSAGKKQKRRLTWSGGQTIEIPRKTAWEISPLTEEDSKSILREAAQERRDTAESSDLDVAIEEEARRALAERFQQTGTTAHRAPKKRRPLLRAFVSLVVLFGVLGGLAAAALYVDGPWSAQVDQVVDREQVTAQIAGAVKDVRRTLRF